MSLTDLKVKQAKAGEKDFWLSDERGLRLLVKTNGSKYWRLKYRFHGKQKTLAIGVYPRVSLKIARQAVDDAKRLIADGIDPGLKKKQNKQQAKVEADDSFEALAKEWWQHQKGTWTDDHANRVWTRLRDNSFFMIGQRPIVQIHPRTLSQLFDRLKIEMLWMLPRGFFRTFVGYAAMRFKLVV